MALFSVSSAVKAECSTTVSRLLPLSEINASTNNDVPDIYVTVNSTTRPDGTTIIVVKTEIRFKGQTVSDNLEVIVVK